MSMKDKKFLRKFKCENCAPPPAPGGPARRAVAARPAQPATGPMAMGTGSEPASDGVGIRITRALWRAVAARPMGSRVLGGETVGLIQDVVDLAAGCFPRRSWHGAETTGAPKFL